VVCRAGRIERHHEYQGPGLNDSGSKAAVAYQFAPAAWGQTRVALVAERLEYETPAGGPWRAMPCMCRWSTRSGRTG
jgi:hypothetical protein